MRARTLIAIGAALFSLGAAAEKPRIQWDDDYDFESVKTFQWRPPREASLEQSDPFLHSRIVNAIEFQLTEHGLTEVTSDPDVFVTYYSSTDTDRRLQSVAIGYGFGGYGTGRWGYWGYRGISPVLVDTRVIDIERGSLVIDVWDADSEQLVWRGSVSDITISDDPAKTQRNVVKAIEQMAKRYDKLREREN